MLACHGPLLVGAMGPISSGLRINRFLVRANTKAIAVIGESAQAVMKVLGAIALVVPFVPKLVKEWAYAGFTFSLTAAMVSHYSVDGLGPETFFPLIILGILMTSYWAFRKGGPQAS